MNSKSKFKSLNLERIKALKKMFNYAVWEVIGENPPSLNPKNKKKRCKSKKISNGST